MAIRDNFSTFTCDARLIAKLHRQNGLQLMCQAKTDGNELARLSASEGVSHADEALSVFHAALALLPNVKAALQVKRMGDMCLLQSGSALSEARQKLAECSM